MQVCVEPECSSYGQEVEAGDSGVSPSCPVCGILCGDPAATEATS